MEVQSPSVYFSEQGETDMAPVLPFCSLPNTLFQLPRITSIFTTKLYAILFTISIYSSAIIISKGFVRCKLMYQTWKNYKGQESKVKVWV